MLLCMVLLSVFNELHIGLSLGSRAGDCKTRNELMVLNELRNRGGVVLIN